MSDVITSIFGWLGALGDSPLGMLMTGLVLGAIGFAGARIDDWLVANDLPFADLVALLNPIWFFSLLIGAFLVVVGIILIIQENFSK